MSPSLDEDGFAIVPGVLGSADIESLTSQIDRYFTSLAGPAKHALRDLFGAIPAMSGIASRAEVRRLVDPVLGPEAFAVRAIYFDKIPGVNWKVPWHQDQAIAVKRRVDVTGFGPWSIKEGVSHVEPPASVLNNMLTVRLHLDDCGDDNGPLRVVPRSHRMGRLTPDAAECLRAEHGEVACTTRAGGVVLMRPLLLHASSSAVSPRHRRVIHLEFAAEDLPGKLEWAFR
jgi:ectoine hydroxylase-related dioxygenase (phytanoyl-CoA dioxygenase family)